MSMMLNARNSTILSGIKRVKITNSGWSSSGITTAATAFIEQSSAGSIPVYLHAGTLAGTNFSAQTLWPTVNSSG